jgi:outer membrane protein
VKDLTRFKWWVGFVAAVGTLVASPAWAELKIGVVDYGRLVEESPQAKAALDSIRTEFTPRQRELQNQQATLKAKEDRLQKDGATMSQDQRTNSEKDLRDSYRELQRKQSEVQDDFNARRNEEMSRLQKILIEQVRIYAKAQNFDLVIADGVIYTTPTIDITPAILAQLQANPGAGASHAKAAAPASAPAPAPPPAKPPGK